MKEKNKAQLNLDARKQRIEESRQDLQQWLLKGPDGRILDKGSDRSLDRDNLKHRLLGGGEFSIAEIKKVLSENIQNHPPQFVSDFYIEIFRLLRLDGNPRDFIKPKEVADFTNQVIYSRFNKEVLPTIQAMNKYVGYCIRLNKNYQYLNNEGVKQLRVYIDQAIETMKESTTHYQFRQSMFKKYNLPYQVDLFPNI
ncbi:hypothetical protein A0256_20685 [Mucilaginibacter sp. PAMC 26640]|nr:hypothetical protein A0256_20685 [Mucilaginibacter sp. PAMC 26640]